MPRSSELCRESTAATAKSRPAPRRERRRCGRARERATPARLPRWRAGAARFRPARRARRPRSPTARAATSTRSALRRHRRTNPASVDTRTSVRSGRRIRPELLGREPPGELDQCSRSRGVVAERPPGACVVTMSNDDDGLLGSARHDRDHVAELDRPEVGEILRPDVLFSRETECADRLLGTTAPPGLLLPSQARGRGTRSRATARASPRSRRRTKARATTRGSVPVVEMENSSASRAGATTTNPTRTRRALRGRSTVPRRSRRPRVRGRAASIAGL